MVDSGVSEGCKGEGKRLHFQALVTRHVTMPKGMLVSGKQEYPKCSYTNMSRELQTRKSETMRRAQTHKDD